MRWDNISIKQVDALGGYAGDDQQVARSTVTIEPLHVAEIRLLERNDSRRVRS